MTGASTPKRCHCVGLATSPNEVEVITQGRPPRTTRSDLGIRDPLLPSWRSLRQRDFIALVVDNGMSDSKPSRLPYGKTRFARRRQLRHILKIAAAHGLEMDSLSGLHCKWPDGA